MVFYVFDLDGTLADCSHRLPFIQQTPRDWRGFFAACAGDKPIMPTIELLWTLDRHSPRIEIWSGRSDECRVETEAWLERQLIPARYLTRMRKAGDHQDDDDLKRGFLRDCDARPDIVFDDRKRVVDMWRREGITCFQVADGDF